MNNKKSVEQTSILPDETKAEETTDESTVDEQQEATESTQEDATAAPQTEEIRKGKLTVLARGRLCNRLRVLLTGLHAARQTNRDLSIGWVPNPGCKAEFSELFEPIEGVNVEADELDLVEEIMGASVSIGRIDDVKQWDIGQSLMGITCGTIRCGSLGNDHAVRVTRDLLIPQPEIVDTVESFAREEFKGKVVGLHIRAQEHFLNITPVEKFAQLIAGLEGEYKAYISTDSEEVEKRLTETFPTRIVSRKKVYGSDTLEGMRDAVADILLLNKCIKIWGTRTSSFNWMASIVRNDVPLVLL